MKKREWIILGVIVLAAAAALFFLHQRPQKSGYTVAVQRGDTIVQEFDPLKDQTFHVDGDVGGLDVEVKEGKWHVIHEKCPNHVCANMGWMGISDTILPITCIPNNIIIYLKESPE